MKSTAEYIDTLIQDFRTMDFIELDRIRGIILECYEMSKIQYKDILATGLYSVEEIDGIFYEDIIDDYRQSHSDMLDKIIHVIKNNILCELMISKHSEKSILVKYLQDFQDFMDCKRKKIIQETQSRLKTTYTLNEVIRYAGFHTMFSMKCTEWCREDECCMTDDSSLIHILQFIKDICRQKERKITIGYTRKRDWETQIHKMFFGGNIDTRLKIRTHDSDFCHHGKHYIEIGECFLSIPLKEIHYFEDFCEENLVNLIYNRLTRYIGKRLFIARDV